MKDSYGEPDEIRKSEYAGMKSELFIYARKDINRTYEFRKTVSGCGGSGKWYVYRMYYTNYLFPDILLYLPPTIVHEPVTNSPPATRIPISAEVKDDEEVVSVTLYYRIVGNEEFSSARMTGGEKEIYSANIPADIVTTTGVEYYIEAWDVDHTTNLPKKGFYTITVAAAAKTVVLGPTDTAPGPVLPPSVEPGGALDNTSPLSP